MSRKNVFAYAALAAAILCWGSIPLFLRYFASYLDAWTVNGVRYGTAALLLTPMLRRRPGSSSRRDRNPWLEALIPAFVNASGQVGFALMPYFLTASVMGFGIRMSFFFTLLGSLWLLPEEHYLFRSPLFWMGSSVCIGGVATLFKGTLERGTTSPHGLLILLSVCALWGFYGVTVRKYLRGFAPHRSFAVVSLYTASVVTSLMCLLGRLSDLRLLAPYQAALLLISAVIGIAMGHILMFYVLGHVGAIIESSAEMLTPFVTFSGAALILGERLSLMQWIGGLGVVTGCLVMIRIPRPHPVLDPRRQET